MSPNTIPDRCLLMESLYFQGREISLQIVNVIVWTIFEPMIPVFPVTTGIRLYKKKTATFERCN